MARLAVIIAVNIRRRRRRASSECLHEHPCVKEAVFFFPPKLAFCPIQFTNRKKPFQLTST